MPANNGCESYKVKTDGPESHRNSSKPPNFFGSLFADARVSRKGTRRFQIFDHRAEIDRLGIERLVFCDLGAIQYLEPIALEHFLAAPAFESDDLTADAFFTGTVEITQIRAHQRTRG